MRHSLKLNYAYQAAWQLLLIVVPILTTPYLSRVLGASQIGVYSVTYSVANYFVMFATLGMSTYGVRLIASCGDSRKERSRKFWAAYCSQAIVGITVSACYIAYALMGPSGGVTIALVWGMWVISATLDISWLMFGVEEFKVPTIRSITTKLISVAVIFIFVRASQDLWIYCAAIAGSYLANQILLWPFIKRYVDWEKPSLKEVSRHFIPNIRLFIPVIAISFYVTLDKVMLGAMTNMTEAGYFEYSDKLSRLPLALVTAMGTVMLPRMTAELGSGNTSGALKMLGESIWAMLAMAFAMMFGIIGISKEFAPIFLGEEFSQCDTIMAIIAIAIPVIATTNVLGRQYLLPTGRDLLFTISVCVGAFVNVCCNLLLIPDFGAEGAAVATVFAETSVLLCQVKFAYRELPLLEYLRNAMPFALFGLIMCLCIRIIANVVDSAWGMTAFGLVLEICSGAAIFIALSLIYCFISKNPNAKSFTASMVRLLSTFKNKLRHSQFR